MSGAERFFDTNVLLYLLSGAADKPDRAESALAAGGIVSVQVLNEFAAVATRKLRLSIPEAREVLEAVRASCDVVPLSEATHDLGLEMAAKYGLSVYDAMIVAAALLAGCRVLVSEDMQHGQVIEGRLTIRSPFRG
jgi:predicted nucleic acid-binding protein